MTPERKTISDSPTTSRTVARQLEILTLCRVKPHTIQELADHFNYSYATLYKDIEFLKKIGQVRSSTFGSGSKSVYYETSESYKTKGLRFHTKTGSFNIDQVVITFASVPQNDINLRFKAVAGAISALYSKAKLREKSLEGGPPVENLKRVLLHSREAIKQMGSLVEQLIDAPIWEDNEDVLTYFKALESMELSKLETWFNNLYYNFYDPLFDQEDSSKKKST